MALWPDLGKGRGMGWATPLSSIVRQRRSYLSAVRVVGLPAVRVAGLPGLGIFKTAAQWTIVLGIGHLTSTLGHPVNTAGRRAFAAQRPSSAKHAASADHLAIQNVAHTSFLSVQWPVVD